MKHRTGLYRFLRFIFLPWFRLLYRPTILGSENIPANRSAVIAGNHMHALDPILVDTCTKRVVRTLAKKELHDGTFGFLFRGVGTIPVDLHSKENKAALSAAIAALEDGCLINLSPEAKRNYTNELLLPFKYGAVAMASRTGSPIVPYAIAGEYRLFSKKLTILFGAPFYVGDMDLKCANKALYDRIAALLISITDPEVQKRKRLTPYDDWRTPHV